MANDYLIALIIYGTLLLITLAGIIVVFMIIHKRRTGYYQEELLRTRIEVQEQSLNWVSREIHDNIGQVLSIVRMQLNHAALTKTKQELMDETIRASALIEQCINDLRNLSHTFNGEMIERMGLPSAIRQELSYVHSLYKKDCNFTEDGTPVLTNEQSLLLFRITQECLNNAVRHADATSISVKLSCDDHKIELSIEDDGQGMEASRHKGSKGMGLNNIRERTNLLGGDLHIISSKGKGCKIIIVLKILNKDETQN